LLAGARCDRDTDVRIDGSLARRRRRRPRDVPSTSSEASALHHAAPMPRARLASIVIAATLASLITTRAARADRLGPAVDISLGSGLFTGELGDQARPSTIMYRLGAGLSRGAWSMLVSGHFLMLGELSEPRTTGSLDYLGVGVEPSVRRELTTGSGLRLHLRLGYGWRWLRGGSQVLRLCDIHGGCDGGYWLETPVYRADGPVLAFGLGWRPRLRGDIWPAFGVELAFSHHTLDRRGADPDLRGTLVSLALNVAVGRAP
jgi:hypothetical protein